MVNPYSIKLMDWYYLSTSPPISPSPSKERGKITFEGAKPLQSTLINGLLG